MITSKSTDKLNEIANTFNEALNAENRVSGINNNAWNQLVNVELTGEKNVATKIYNRPRGLMKAVQSVFQGASASPLPDTDYVVSRNLIVEASHEISEELLMKHFTEGMKRSFQSGSLNLSKILEDGGYNDMLSELQVIASQSLLAKFYNQVSKISGDAIHGQASVAREEGGTENFDFEVVTVAPVTTSWADSATATPRADMRRVNEALQLAPNNTANNLGLGGTVMRWEIFDQLAETQEIKDSLGVVINQSVLGNQYINEEDFNRAFNRPVRPSFGLVSVDPGSNYEDEAGNPGFFLRDNYIYSASGTQVQSPGGLPSAPIQLLLTPVNRFSNAGNMIASNIDGVTLEIYEVDTRPTQGSKGGKAWQFVAVSHISMLQYKPVARMQVIL